MSDSVKPYSHNFGNMDNIFPTEQGFMMPSRRGAAAPRGGHDNNTSNSTNGPTPSHGYGYAPSNHASNRHDWYGYNMNAHAQFPHHPYAFHNPHQSSQYAPYFRYQYQGYHDAIDRGSSSFDDIPSPPHGRPRQHLERMEYHPEMMPPDGNTHRFTLPPRYCPYDQARHNDPSRRKGQAHSTLVTPSKENTLKPSPASGESPKQSSATRPKATPASSNDLIWQLGEYDVLCGRGAPTDYNRGNAFLRKLVSEYQTVYLCSKRSDKPAIAWKLLDIVSSRGGRFVKRNKTRKNTTFAWEQLNEKQAYEKICQALREGAPELRRRMLKDMGGGEKLNDVDAENSGGAIAEEDSASKSQAEDNSGKKKKETKTLSVRTRSAVKEESPDDVYAI